MYMRARVCEHARVRIGFVYQCVRARARLCVCVCVCVRARARDVLCMCVRGTSLYRPKERPELSAAFEFDPWTSFYNYMTTLGEKKLTRKEFANSFYLSNTF